MANKYAEFSKAKENRNELFKDLHKRNSKTRMCMNKIPYESKETAIKEQPNQRTYKCPHCKKFHLTTQTKGKK